MPDEPMTGTALEDALRAGALERPAPDIEGMVKAHENEGFISFSHTDCESWVDLPTDLIDKAEHVGQQSCRDHSHPRVRLTLKPSDDPAAQILMALLAPSRSGMTTSAPMMPSMPSFMRAGGQQAPDGGFVGPHGGFQPSFQSTARIRPVGPGAVAPGGGLFAWGCWQSECCDCIETQCAPTPAGHQHCWCSNWTCRPCERCIWPW
jgi:hypothetical protein